MRGALGPGVYFILDRGSGCVKVGWSSEPVQRLRDLQTGNPRELELVALVPNVKSSAERSFHEQFRAHQVRGEWFRVEGAVEEAMERWGVALDEGEEGGSHPWEKPVRVRLSVAEAKELDQRARRLGELRVEAEFPPEWI